METGDKLEHDIDRLRSEKERYIPIEKIAEHIELLKAVEMLETMCKLANEEDTKEMAKMRFETTGKRRNYGQERRAIIKFANILQERLNRYFV